MVGGGKEGGRITVEDHRSHYKTAPLLPSEHTLEIVVPGGPVPRLVTAEFAPGTVFHGIRTADPQPVDTTWKFSWEQLPEPL